MADFDVDWYDTNDEEAQNMGETSVARITVTGGNGNECVGCTGGKRLEPENEEQTDSSPRGRC